MNWPSVANGNPETDSWDTHAANFGPLKNLHCPKLDRGLSALLEDMDQRGLLKETLVVAIGEFGRSPRMGVSTSGNSQRARRPRPLAVLLQRGGRRLRHRARHAVRRIGPDGVLAEGEAGPSERSAGDHLLRARHRSRHGDLQPPESAPRAGEGQDRRRPLGIEGGKKGTEKRGQALFSPPTTPCKNKSIRSAKIRACPLFSVPFFPMSKLHRPDPSGPIVAWNYRLTASSKCTPSVFCSAVRMLERFAAEGLPLGPSMRIKLLAGMCVRFSRS